MTPPDVLELDCRNLRCPLPVLRLEKTAASARPGTRIMLRATDPMARIDIPHFCTLNGHACTLDARGPELRFTILLGSGA